jgi:hypothetical protein
MPSLLKKLPLLATDRFFFTYSHFCALMCIILFDIDSFFAEEVAFTGYNSIFCAYSHFSPLIWIILFDIGAYLAEEAAFTGYISISFCLFSL